MFENLFTTDIEITKKCSSIFTNLFKNIIYDFINEEESSLNFFKFNNVSFVEPKTVTINTSEEIVLFKFKAETEDGILEINSKSKLIVTFKPFKENKLILETRKNNLGDFSVKYNDDEKVDKEDLVKKIEKAFLIDPDIIKSLLPPTEQLILFCEYHPCYLDYNECYSEYNDLLLKFLEYGLLKKHINQKDFTFIIHNANLYSDYFQSPKEKLFFKYFNQSFQILKENNHDKGNIYEFNDFDNFLNYFENEKICAIVNRSQYSQFCLIKDKSDDRLRVYLSTEFTDDEYYQERLDEFKEGESIIDTLIEEINTTYDVNFQSLSPILHEKHVQLVDYLYKNYKNSSNLIYDSELGFSLKQHRYASSLYFHTISANENLCSVYNKDPDILVLTDNDYRSHTYLIRKALSKNSILYKNRATVLSHLFLCAGNGYYWKNGNLVDDTNIFYDYPEHPLENGIESMDLCFVPSFHSTNLLTKAPENITEEWKEILFEVFDHLETLVKKDIYKNDGSTEYLLYEVYMEAQRKIKEIQK